MKVTQIVPLFAPVLDGVGDYALNLARCLRKQHGMQSDIAVCDPRWKGESDWDGFPVHGAIDFDPARLQRALHQSQRIILHYVGYGFHRRGVPFWLVGALEDWVRTNPGGKLVTVFHEIWSAGPPWRTVFYLSALQRWLVRRLQRLSSRAFISTHWMHQLLEAGHPGKSSWLPIPSNLPMPGVEQSRPRLRPPWRVLLFGQTWTRTPAIRLHRPLLLEMMRRNLLDQVWVLGKEASAPPAPSEDVALLATFLPLEKIHVAGQLEPAPASAVFTQADFYLSAHQSRDLCKSGSSMAAIAAGCPVVVADRTDPAPLREGEHFLAYDANAAGINQLLARLEAGALPGISAAEREWYLACADWPIVAGAIGREIAA